MESRKKRPISPQEEIHRSYLMAKQLYREFRGFVKTLADIRETVKQMLTTLDESNKKSNVC